MVFFIQKKELSNAKAGNYTHQFYLREDGRSRTPATLAGPCRGASQMVSEPAQKILNLNV